MLLLGCQLAVAFCLLSALAALGADRLPWLMKRVCFPLLGAAGALTLVAGVTALVSGEVQTATLPLGLPWLHWHLRLDPLSGFFVALIGTVVFATSLFGPGYVREFSHGPYSLAALGGFTGLFIASMLLVVLAADAFLFMIAWELMSLASYFLVTYQHKQAANRRAGFLYLLMAQVGGLCILLAFGVLAGFGGGFGFEAMRSAALSPAWAAAAFALAFVGFGMKAGLVPLHVWLPEAHPVAPSHVSALMSGVMLKVAVYGFLRVVFDLIGSVQWGWGLAVLAVGSVSALLGVLYALMQQDLKRLLAYSSVENMGIVFMGLGLSMIFLGTGHRVLGSIGLIAALYHCLGHAMFKSLLFLGAGAISQRSHEQDLERMGGLLKRMPYTGGLFLIGALSISALPPFNGFVSEWLTFQTALQGTALNSGVLRILIPVAAAVLALTGALAAACFVRAYGVGFLGLARTRHVRHAREVGAGMLAGQALLASLCLLLGVLPTTVVDALNSVAHLLVGAGLPQATARGWLWLTPVAPQVASYSAPLVLAGITLVGVLGFLFLNRKGTLAPRYTRAWDCGFGPLSSRMAYTASAFSMPLRRTFRPLWALREAVERSTDGARITVLRYNVQIIDRTWGLLYAPIGRAVRAAARRITRLQTGSIRTYLGYSFFTLVLLLWLIS